MAVRRGQHYGAASVYALMAVEAGMIGFTTTSTGPATVAAYGSRRPATANNAIAWGIPTRSGAPFVLDMACAISSWGKVESLKLYGRELPPGWALDAAGNPTQDPKAAKTLLPFAGARGYGMAFLSSVLAGALVGGRMPLHKTMNVASDGSEHFFYAIDIQAICRAGPLLQRAGFDDGAKSASCRLRTASTACGCPASWNGNAPGVGSAREFRFIATTSKNSKRSPPLSS